ncbi:hypothetical protein WH52_06950 [Tenacibaculum holothuriorum]|uniref:Uncharacterized protein n=1 Tax=Tenacibaculum holothuriorum TaxID=1635173 RepID=A0A1Y2PDH1_9FLAO|nr:SusD/RagB family nutrient-binding outer membrane lipoprotein [Tenacibaculum holothuriorum]OSY88485.1 hypothetical protein WH52_06950 [Tenacibaculum holothuriorum]
MKKVLLIFLALTTIYSCDDLIEGVNDNPNSFTDAPAHLLLAQSELIAAKISESQSSRLSNIFTDQFTGADRQYITLNNYTITSADFDDDWSDVYAGVTQARLAREKAIATGDAALEGVSLIMEALLFGEAAALWGDIPYTEALRPDEFPDPKYDGQASVLSAIQSTLDEGISKVGSLTVNGGYGAPIFSSSASWAKVAHSLKARYYLVAKNYPMALAEAKLGLSSKSEDVMIQHANEAGKRNLYYQFGVEQREGYLQVSGPSHLKNLLDGSTPRLLATPGDSERASKYFNGVQLNYTPNGYFAVDASFPLISYYEVKLIEAECEQRGGQDGNAQTALNAVRTELATEYMASFPSSTATGQDLLRQILEEKYITLIGSLQVYHDVRRTQNLIGVPVKNTSAGNTVIPQRFLYPQVEVSANKNFPGVVDRFVPTPINN